MKFEVDRTSVVQIEAAIKDLLEMYERCRNIKLFIGKLEISKGAWFHMDATELNTIAIHQIDNLGRDMRAEVAREHLRAHMT